MAGDGDRTDGDSRRARRVGYGIAAGLLAAAAVAALIAVVGGGGGADSEQEAQLYPTGGRVPAQRTTDLRSAAELAGCRLQTIAARPPDHTADLAERITYNSNPPTNGKHYQAPAADGAYAVAPDAKQLVHSLEHGRVIWWFRASLPGRDRASLKALFDEDGQQLTLTPNRTRMPYVIAASAWNGKPEPNGAGRLLGCERMNERTFDALRAFRDEHRGNGLEPVP